ncbi:unnamed protein product, partial [Didymodactylos carnosus]
LDKTYFTESDVTLKEDKKVELWGRRNREQSNWGPTQVEIEEKCTFKISAFSNGSVTTVFLTSSNAGISAVLSFPNSQDFTNFKLEAV